MLQEIYMRDSTDPYFVSTVLHHSDKIESLISQIKMILFTKKGEVLGDFDFGINIEDMIFELSLDQSTLEKRITEAVQKYCPAASYFNTQIKTEFYKGTVRDICFINVFIEGVKLYGVAIR